MSGINDSAANDEFCRRIVRLCNVTVVAIGYRLAPESQYLTTFDDELKVLNWMNKQVDLVQLGDERFKGFDRCVLLRVSCCANIADYLARKAVEAGKLLDLVKVVIQVLMYPFFIGSILTKSEIKLANLYIYDKASYLLAPPEEECDLDPPAANPLILGREPPLKYWMRDPATAYSEELWKANVDASILDYKDAVHEFATLDFLLQTPKALAYADDIAI